MKPFKIILILLLFDISNAYGQKYLDSLEKAERKARIISYWRYGLIDVEKEFAASKVAQKYQFSFRSVAGCVLTKKVIKRIDRHNDEVSGILNKRFRGDWKKIFYPEVDSVYLIDQTIINYFNQDSSVSSIFYRISASIDNRVILRVLPTLEPSLYTLRAFLMNQFAEATEKYIYSVQVRYPQLVFSEPQYYK